LITCSNADVKERGTSQASKGLTPKNDHDIQSQAMQPNFRSALHALIAQAGYWGCSMMVAYLMASENERYA